MEMKKIEDLPDILFDEHFDLVNEMLDLLLLLDENKYNPEKIVRALSSVHAVLIASFIPDKDEAVKYAILDGQFLPVNVRTLFENKKIYDQNTPI